MGASPGQIEDTDCRWIDGRIADLWEFTIDTAGPWRIEARSKAFDPKLSIRGDGCEELASNDDCGNSLDACVERNFEPGAYVAVVSAAFAEERGEYSVHLERRGDGAVRPGDCNADGTLGGADAVTLLRNLFLRSTTTLPCGDGGLSNETNRFITDVDANGQVDVTDAIRLLQHIYLGGPPPQRGDECVVRAGCAAACAR